MMRQLRRQLTVWLLPVLLILAGCQGRHPTPSITLDEANERFIKTFEEEYELTPVIRPVADTLWIYVPTDGPMIDIVSSQSGPSQSNQPSKKMTISYLDVSFEDQTIFIEYDITDQKAYPIDLGYSSTFSSLYAKVQRKAIEVIQRTYFEIEQVPGNLEFKDPLKQQARQRMVEAYVLTDKAPEFLILVVADIQKGIEIESILYLEDLQRVLSLIQSITREEYSKRYITELRGHTAIIDDKEGRHLNYQRLKFTEFLAKQIKARIEYQYKKSSFPPSKDVKREILNQVYQTLVAYRFNDFIAVHLHDLDSTIYHKIPREELHEYIIQPQERQGSYYVIGFDAAPDEEEKTEE